MGWFKRLGLAALLWIATGAAQATFHTFVIDQVFSNASGTVQFVVLREAAGAGGQHLFAGHELRAGTSGGTTGIYVIPRDLPSAATAGRRVLFATQGFADLGIVTPDYVIPNGFVPHPAGFVDFAGVSRFTYSALPEDGVNALDPASGVRPNVATNFAGASGSVAAAPQAEQNFTALWWVPTESGWGLNVLHQADIVFATLFTYDTDGTVMWLVMSGGERQSDGRTYAGPLYRTTGPAFNAVPFTPIGPGNLTQVGTMAITFTGANAATLTYTHDNVQVTKSIQRNVFGTRAANCVPGAGSRAAITNYQDLWWVPSESGWGLNVTHQDQVLFATLFTYGANGRGLWLVMSEGRLQGDGSYLGTLYQTTGPPFNANPFTPIGPGNLTAVGTMRLRFSNGENGTLTYTVNDATVTKQIVRQLFRAQVPFCS